MFSICQLSQMFFTPQSSQATCRFFLRGREVKHLLHMESTRIPLDIQTLEKKEFDTVRQSLIEIARPSYRDPELVLQKDWDHCDRLYLGFRERELACFFMVGRERLEIKERSIPSVYLGLGCLHQKLKNSGIIRFLFKHFIKEAQEWQKDEGIQIPLWYTTPTPSTYGSVSQIFMNSQPYLDRTFTPEAAEVVEAIKKKMNWTHLSGHHPFVVKGITNVRYSPLETERIANIVREKKFSFLQDLDVQENRGDRLIGICYLPEKFNYQIEEISNIDHEQLTTIGRLRFDVWNEETFINQKIIQNEMWIEPIDLSARHWVVKNDQGQMIGAARMTIHQKLNEHPDGHIWEKAGRHVPLPFVMFNKLIIHKDIRGQGIGKELIDIRIQAARAMGAKIILILTSQKNMPILLSLGFYKTEIEVVFPEKPEMIFYGLEYIL